MLNNTMPEPASVDEALGALPVFQSAENLDKTKPTPVIELGIEEEIKAACEECAAYNNGEGFFGNQWADRVLGLMLPSYKLLTLVGNDPELLDIAIKRSEVETTAATRKNPALVILKIAARPTDTAERKLCSGWAKILNEALTSKIPVEQFVEWTKEPKEPGSKETNKRDGQKKEVKPNQLTLRLSGTEKRVEEIFPLPVAMYPTLVAALTTSGPQSERVLRLGQSFLRLAKDLEKAEVLAATEAAHV
ncbi:hypothetical protein HNR00_001217 [Methylorubrum rhodinum]|uniref:Uncharacterized protein n=1 Tax=Methylorubrum rhodinum TaxID=29428 RepID=A0A840ZFJ4_9HYPH|nr:hypothetical protein [Methylorubrum rhodinum]MBB5756519.1 hypothetical protein [Methylorubrum rhodinum]